MEHPENSGEYKGLVVNAGIEQPSSVNPYLKRKPKKRQLSVAEYVEGIVKGLPGLFPAQTPGSHGSWRG